jgi:hypothetical protein
MAKKPTQAVAAYAKKVAKSRKPPAPKKPRFALPAIKPRPPHLCRWWETAPGTPICLALKAQRRVFCRECERV